MNVIAQPVSQSSDQAAKGSDARAAALDALLAVVEKNQALDEALNRAFAQHKMEPRDRAFARLIVTTTLRRRGQLTQLISQLRDRQGEIGPPSLREIIYLGLAQLVYLQTPAYAVVSSALELLKGNKARKARGLVNALLRQADRTMQDWQSDPAFGDGPEGALLNLPDWLADALSVDYGEQTAAEIAAAHLIEPPLDLTLKDGSSDPLEGERLPTGSLRRANSGVVSDLPGFEQGHWWVQDAAAALPAKLFGPVQGRTVVDLCAAPGGKTAQLAAAGANVIAIDRSKNRLKRLQENLDRLSLPAEVICADALKWKPDAPVDLMLLDAPCSATGTIRRHPDLPWTRHPGDVEKLVDLQDRLLRHAAKMLAPGGTLVWCTCSLLSVEGEDRVDQVLADGLPVERVPVKPEEIGGLAEAITEKGDVRTLPIHLAKQGGMDGFHIARLQRVS